MSQGRRTEVKRLHLYNARREIINRQRGTYRFGGWKLVLEIDLRRCYQGSAHQNAEYCETNGVILFPLVGFTRMIWERRAVIKGDSDEEHGQAPSETSEHTLMAVSVKIRFL